MCDVCGCESWVVCIECCTFCVVCCTFVIFDELSVGVCMCPVFLVWLPVSCFMCNVSGLSVVCCVVYCVLGLVSAVRRLSVCYVHGRCWLVCVFGAFCVMLVLRCT